MPRLFNRHRRYACSRAPSFRKAALPNSAETRQTVAPFKPRNDRRSILAHLTHVTHSQMLETRRRRKRGKKDMAGAAKRAKKLAKWNARKARAGAKAPGPAVKTGEAGGPDLA